jgi:hypothetical protein
MLEALCSRTDGHATKRVAAELEGFLRTDA